MASRRRGFLGRLIGFVILLLVIYFVLSVLDFLGVFIKGTYEGVLGTEVTLELNGKVGDSDSMTWRSYGNKIIFYHDGEEMYDGTIQNGVINYDVLGLPVRFYKDGETDRDPEGDSFVDYVRGVLKPGTKLVGKISDFLTGLIED